MDQEIPNDHQSSPAQIVAFMTGSTQSLHSEPEFTVKNPGFERDDAQETRDFAIDEPSKLVENVEESQEAQELRDAETARSNPAPEAPLPEAVDLPPPLVEIPRLVPRQSTFVPAPNTWWLFVDRDPQYAVRVNYQENDQLVNITQMTFRESGELERVEVGSEPLHEFRAGFYIEADSGDSLRFTAILKSGASKKRVKTSDPERLPSEPIPSVSALFESIGAELGVDKSHVQRLTESALEGVRTFVALKSFIDSSPVVSALAEILRSPMLLEAAKIVVTEPVQAVAEDTFHLLLNDALAPVAESLQETVTKRIETLQNELLARRQWEKGFDVFALQTEEKIKKLESRIEGLVSFVENLPPDAFHGAISTVVPTEAIDSRINPQTNDIREQIANLFERCDNLERNRLKDQQARSRAEKARKQASAAKAPERKQAVNAASRTLQERKRREKKERESLERATARRVGPRNELPKRGRGRPPTRKAVAEVNLFDGSPVKRGRGRPRKNP